ncbi:MAG: hypothetical protein FWD73_07110 [Polyangiaceae bacterium]|nr:hypothetical protein [Polyangiaceae bacterium]
MNHGAAKPTDQTTDTSPDDYLVGHKQDTPKYPNRNGITIGPYEKNDGGYATAVYAEDRSWILYVPNGYAQPRRLPELHVCVGISTDATGAPRREYAPMNCFIGKPQTDEGVIDMATAFDYESAAAAIVANRSATCPEGEQAANS